jgi:hypothetical protein
VRSTDEGYAWRWGTVARARPASGGAIYARDLRRAPSRWLRMVDPTNRELLLSFGAVIETIRQAAPAVGKGVDIEMLADRLIPPTSLG